jgi:ABC-type glycerol-3-phosphate transport system substrate-binding protein
LWQRSINKPNKKSVRGRKNMICRRSIIRLLSTAAVATLAGIGAAAAQDEQVVRFLHNETDPPSIEFFNKAIADFEAANPDIRIEMEAISTDGRLQKVLAAISARTMPELLKILPEERYEFAKRGFLEPLDDVAAQIGVDDFAPGSLVRVDGTLYDLPYAMSNFSVLWYRSDLLEAKGITPPTNWDELKAAAKALTEDKDGDGTPETYGFIFPAGKNRAASLYLAQMMWSAGGTFFDKDLNVTFDNPGTVAALHLLKELAQYSPPGIGSYSYSDMINTYMTGTIAMDIYTARLLANAVRTTPALAEVTKAAPMPRGPTGAPVKFVNTNNYAVSTEAVGSQAPDAAKKFLTFLITGERARDFSLTAFPHLIPPILSVQRDPGLVERDAFLAEHPEIVSLVFDTAGGMDFEAEAGATFTPEAVTQSGIANPYIGAIVSRNLPAVVLQRVILEGESPEDAAAWGAAEMEQIVADVKDRLAQ